MFPKTIAISLAPNNFHDDVRQAIKQLFYCFSWKKGKGIQRLEKAFENYFPGSYIFSFNSGRAALEIGLKSLCFPEGSEVLMQAFSCVVVANSIRFANLKPVFVDIGKNTFSLNPQDLEKKITSKSRAVIVQNLFGIPDELEKIMAIAKKHNLVVIEDCAQSLGASYKGKKIGQFGAFSFFSFGRDKVISSVFGGILITKQKNIAESINKIYQKLVFPDNFWIFKQLLHPVVFSLITPTYFWFKLGKFTLGKFILFIYQKTGLLDFPVKVKEKKGQKIDDYPKRLPNSLAILALHQFKKLEKFNENRIKIARFYLDKLAKIKNIFPPSINPLSQPIFLRFPILVPFPQALIKEGKKQNILLGNWYDFVVAPHGVELGKIGYRPGSCPQAEEYTRMIVNLPTNPRMDFEEAQRVVNLVKNFYENSN